MANTITDRTELNIPAMEDWLISETNGKIAHKSKYSNIKTDIAEYAVSQVTVTNNAYIFHCSYRLDGNYSASDIISGAILSGTDGGALSAGQIVLRYNNLNQQRNGLYVVQSSGAAVRYSKANTGGKLMYSVAMPNAGLYKGKWYKCTNYAAVIDTDPVYYTEIFTPTQSLETTDSPTFAAVALPGGDIQTQIDNKASIAFAEIYVSDGVTPQTIPTGTAYTKVTAYTNNGESSNCEADATNDKIRITSIGKYQVDYTASYTSGTNNVTFRGAVFAGGVEQANVHSGGQMGLSGAMRSTSSHGIINVTSVPTDIDVRIRHDQGGNVAITHVYANLTVKRIG